MSDLQNPIFHDDDRAREWLESHLWPDGPVCPHCGVDDVTKVEKRKATSKQRTGLYQCNAKECRQQFTVTVGTVYERSKIPLSKWLMATYLLSASKKGISTRQLSRMLGVSVKSAWFMTHRIREGMKPSPHRYLGGTGKIVEADETFIGGKEKNRHKHKRGKVVGGAYGKQTVFSLVERGGHVRSTHVPSISGKNIRLAMKTNASRKSHLMTDEGGQYVNIGKQYASHGSVNHSADEYVRGDIHVNTAENYFSILKRGITGVYHAVSEQHLQRYLVEFDFRYSYRKGRGFSDMDATKVAIKGIKGRRLTYRRPDEAALA